MPLRRLFIGIGDLTDRGLVKRPTGDLESDGQPVWIKAARNLNRGETGEIKDRGVNREIRLHDAEARRPFGNGIDLESRGGKHQNVGAVVERLQEIVAHLGAHLRSHEMLRAAYEESIGDEELGVGIVLVPMVSHVVHVDRRSLSE